MSISAQTLIQAREALVAVSVEKLELVAQVKDQGRKIADLEREVQKQATAASQAQQMLAQASREIEALRSQLPGEAAVRAHDALAEFLAAPADQHPALRIAA